MFIEFFLFLIGILGYLYFDNRRKYGKLPPGPWGLPLLGYLPFLGKAPCETIAKLSKTYGNMLTLKLGQYPVVFVNEIETIKELFKLDVLTGRFQLDLFEPRGEYGLGLLEGKEWMEVRRFMMRCLRDLGFGKKSMESSILEEVMQTRQFLQDNTDKPLYLKPLIEVAVVNALWGMMTSEKYDIEDPLKRKILHILADGISNQNIVGISVFLPWLAKLAPNYSGYNKGMEYFGAPDQLAHEIMTKHMESYSRDHERDFIDVALTKIYKTTDPLSMFYKETGLKNLHYTIVDLFFAGADTMSSTLGWSFLYLSTWPEIQKKVHAEIDAVVGRSRLPSLDDRPKMPYIEATMCEVLRKSSMVPLGLLHTAIESFEFGGFSFPKRTIFLANIHHVHQDPKYWGDPEEFRPERFITAKGTFRKDDHVIPFFTGKRTCPGESLAMVEYFLFFVGIMQNFKFTLDPNEPKPNLGPRAGFILMPPQHNLYVLKR